MIPRRIIQSLNTLHKKSPNKINGLRKLSTNHSDILNIKYLRNISSFNKKKHCNVCNYTNSQIRHAATNILTPDNIVLSPYYDVSVPDCLLHEIIWQYLDRFPDKIAIECSVTGRKYSFAQLRDRCKKFAASLLKSGFKPGQVVAIILPNLPEFPIALLGAIEAGLIVSTVNPAYTADEICHQLLDSNSICAITFADKLNVVQSARVKLAEKTKGSVDLKIISIQDYDGESREYPQGIWSFREMTENNIDTAIVNSISSEHNLKPEDVIALPYSSGTTGLPKGVCLTHCNLVSNITQMENEETEHIMFPTDNFQDIMPAILPFFHIYGLNIILMQAIRHGAKLVTLPKFDPESFLTLLKEHKSTILYLVPPILLFLGMHPSVTKEHLYYMRFLTSGAAPIGASDIERCLGKMPDSTVFLQAYGLTETSPMVLIPPNKKNNNYATVGAPASLTKAKIVNENGEALGVFERGELLIHGPQVMKGYLNRPEATAETIDAEGWLHSGDIGYYDKDGLFYIVDRKKELIKVKGFQVAPAELEELLRSHPKVADVAVIGVPDTRAGEVPIAYVVPRTGQESVAPDDLKSYIADKVADYKQLSQVIISKSIPKSPSGKILRRVLKESHLSLNK